MNKKTLSMILVIAACANAAIWTAVVWSKPHPEYNIKTTPASITLMGAARDISAKAAELNTAAAQADKALQDNQKDNIAQVQALQTQLGQQVHADPKYKDLIDKLDATLKLVNDAKQKAQQDFNEKSKSLQTAGATDQQTINSLVPVVRSENKLPADVDFDPQTQTWHKVEPKK